MEPRTVLPPRRVRYMEINQGEPSTCQGWNDNWFLIVSRFGKLSQILEACCRCRYFPSWWKYTKFYELKILQDYSISESSSVGLCRVMAFINILHLSYLISLDPNFLTADLCSIWVATLISVVCLDISSTHYIIYPSPFLVHNRHSLFIVSTPALLGFMSMFVTPFIYPHTLVHKSSTRQIPWPRANRDI